MLNFISVQEFGTSFLSLVENGNPPICEQNDPYSYEFAIDLTKNLMKFVRVFLMHAEVIRSIDYVTQPIVLIMRIKITELLNRETIII